MLQPGDQADISLHELLDSKFVALSMSVILLRCRSDMSGIRRLNRPSFYYLQQHVDQYPCLPAQSFTCSPAPLETVDVASLQQSTVLHALKEECRYGYR